MIDLLLDSVLVRILNYNLLNVTYYSLIVNTSSLTGENIYFDIQFVYLTAFVDFLVPLVVVCSLNNYMF